MNNSRVFILQHKILKQNDINIININKTILSF